MADFNAQEAVRRLMALEDRGPVVDRASMLPIGQYEDGGLTFAWPGFLKDAWEGANRSLVAQEGSPVYDDGGRYASGANMDPLDAFNAASIGPMSGVAARAAGVIPRNALGSGGSDALSRAAAPHEARFDAFRDKINALDPATEKVWAASKHPETYGIDTPFEFVERAKVIEQPNPFEADVDLRMLQTKQPSVWGHQVKSIAENGVTGPVPEGRHLPWVRMTGDGKYVLYDGNHRMAAEVMKGNDVAKAIVYANAPEASLPGLLGHMQEEPQNPSTQNIMRLYEDYMRQGH